MVVVELEAKAGVAVDEQLALHDAALARIVRAVDAGTRGNYVALLTSGPSAHRRLAVKAKSAYLHTSPTLLTAQLVMLILIIIFLSGFCCLFSLQVHRGPGRTKVPPASCRLNPLSHLLPLRSPYHALPLPLPPILTLFVFASPSFSCPVAASLSLAPIISVCTFVSTPPRSLTRRRQSGLRRSKLLEHVPGARPRGQPVLSAHAMSLYKTSQASNTRLWESVKSALLVGGLA